MTLKGKRGAGGASQKRGASGARGDAESAEFERALGEGLADTEEVARRAAGADGESGQTLAWGRARKLVEEFRPVPWFIWRLCNFVLGKPGEIRPISEGLVFGLRRLLYAAASDPLVGAGEKISDPRRAVAAVAPDVIAAGAVIHAISRRLGQCDCERIWRPILEDAFLRANIGYMVGERYPEFGPGRGMLAGFAGRSGLAVLIGMGTLDDARAALELLAAGRQVSEVGLKVYSCDPLHVSAMILSATGCGRDAAFGSVSYALSDRAEAVVSNPEQSRWLAAFTIVEAVRMNRAETVEATRWRSLGLEDERDQEDLLDRTTPLLRRGHRFGWLE